MDIEELFKEYNTFRKLGLDLQTQNVTVSLHGDVKDYLRKGVETQNRMVAASPIEEVTLPLARDIAR